MKWLIVLSFLSFVAPVYAQEQPQQSPTQACAARDEVRTKLKLKFHEKPVAEGLQRGSTIIEVWANKKFGTFTIIVNRTDGMSCMIAAGDNWNMINEPDGDPL